MKEICKVEMIKCQIFNNTNNQKIIESFSIIEVRLRIKQEIINIKINNSYNHSNKLIKITNPTNRINNMDLINWVIPSNFKTNSLSNNISRKIKSTRILL